MRKAICLHRKRDDEMSLMGSLGPGDLMQMSSLPVRLSIGTPCYGGQITSVYATSLLRLQRACQERSVGFHVMLLSGDALIARARQNIVASFLGDENATHLLFIDADIGFAPEQVFRLLDFDVDMCAAVYPTKRLQPGTIVGSPDALSYVVEIDGGTTPTVRAGFVKVRYAGTGFLMIRRSALLTMIEAYPELRYTAEHQVDDPLRDSIWRSALFNSFIDQASGVYLSEDYSFCRRWTDLGGEIWMDGESRLDHVGPFTFSGDFRVSLEAGQSSGRLG